MPINFMHLIYCLSRSKEEKESNKLVTITSTPTENINELLLMMQDCDTEFTKRLKTYYTDIRM